MTTTTTGRKEGKEEEEEEEEEDEKEEKEDEKEEKETQIEKEKDHRQVFVCELFVSFFSSIWTQLRRKGLRVGERVRSGDESHSMTTTSLGYSIIDRRIS